MYCIVGAILVSYIATDVSPNSFLQFSNKILNSLIIPLKALLLAEICAEAGLPPGVFNVVTGKGSFGTILAKHIDVDKVAFTGSTYIGQVLRRETAGSGKKLSLELGGKSPVIIFDDCDLDSAIEGIVDAIWFNQGQVCSAGSRLLIQESSR